MREGEERQVWSQQRKPGSVEAVDMQRSEHIRAGAARWSACLHEPRLLISSCHSVRRGNTSGDGIISLDCRWSPTWAGCVLVHGSPGEVTLHSFGLAETFLGALKDGVAFDCWVAPSL